ncbi:hypothetical protein QKW35_20420 [Pontibacterium granulatum]|uniref:hypothetical protein n=1 Tax=Pontibacterium granulatum TaxID=2036029 RepID=UPI00249C7389|nr:hypothetical protein [Pontibacterium granulatum]MDI3326748.1 hypothetical protein [Pontibacterium granulatum]
MKGIYVYDADCARLSTKVASLAETQRRLQLCGFDTADALLIELLYEGLVSRLQVKQNLDLIEQTKLLVTSIQYSN